MEWLYLCIAIAAEVIATSALKASDSFTRIVPSLIVIAGYCTAFYLLSLTLQRIPLGVAYAVWSALGIVLVTIVGAVRFGQSLDTPAQIGITMIVCGVLIINLFSKSAAQ